MESKLPLSRSKGPTIKAVSLHDAVGISPCAVDILSGHLKPLSSAKIMELLSQHEEFGLHISQIPVKKAEGGDAS